MNLLTRVFAPLAIVCGAAWLLKQLVIVASGGAGAESALIAGLWGTGMLTFLLACAVGTALFLRGAPVWARVLAAAGAIPVAFLTLLVIDLIVESVYRADGWFVDEVPLVLAALVMGALGVQALSSARHP